MMPAWMHPLVTIVTGWSYALWIHWAGQRFGAPHIAAIDMPRTIPDSWAVVGVALTNQAVQLLTFWLLMWCDLIDANPDPSAVGIMACKLLWAAVLLDTWQYATHRALHEGPRWLRTVHAVHHELEAPMSYGAFYQHVLEGAVMDALGFAIAQSGASLSLGASTLFATLATIKTAHDHSTYRLPIWLDPVVAWGHITGNDAIYHWQHHQGARCNFQQPFFTFWDTICGTGCPIRDATRVAKNRP